MTLEDETGNVNVIVWNNVLQQQRRRLWLRHGLIDYSALPGQLQTASRDFQ